MSSESTKKYTDLFRQLRSQDAYWKSYLVTRFTSALSRIMKNDGATSADLARALGVSPAYVSKALRGGENFSVETMVKLASAVGAVVHIHVAKRGVPVHWRELPGDSSRSLGVAAPIPFELGDAQ